MTGRELLEALGPILKPARDLRYVPDDDFDDVDDAELEVVERHLHAIAYSCQQGATKMRRIIVTRAAAEAASRSSS